jgi:FtsP/CotA-like multicopper oxidase with cupredoxin domain
MIYKNFVKRLVMLVLMVAALALMGTPSFAAELAAVEANATMPDGTVIPMWGFTEVSDAATYVCPVTPVTWEGTASPTLTATEGGTLTINLKNCLDESVSVFIPGQLKALDPAYEDKDGSGRMRVTSFDTATAMDAVGNYSWSGLKAGTYLYHSGTHPQVQVQMGLYGVLVVNGASYPDFDQDAVLLYSEIDPALHEAVDSETYGTPTYPSTFDYKPTYFLINGTAYPQTPDIALTTSEDVLLRFANAGLKTHVPTLQGLYMSVIAEDGNLYPYPKEQYSIELTAAKTMDAMVNVGTAGRYALYDRSLHLTNAAATGGGMLTFLNVASGGGPTATDDDYSTPEDTPLSVPLVEGVLANDTGASEATVVTGTSAGSLIFDTDGSFDYTPNENFNGTDIFTYVANDGLGGPDSNLATVRITVSAVNDEPIAMADAYDAIEGETLSVPALGVLANDVDVDDDPLTASPVGTPPPGLTLNSDGSFDYTPAGVAGAVETFDYVANDGLVDSAPATVTITVVGAPANISPFANDDFAETPKNTDVTFNVTGNDVDPDGVIDVTSVVITTGAITTRGGSVVNNGDGTVTFTPKRGFRGTDTFSYNVEDDPDGIPGNHDGLTSNEATVRVNVTK